MPYMQEERMSNGLETHAPVWFQLIMNMIYTLMYYLNDYFKPSVMPDLHKMMSNAYVKLYIYFLLNITAKDNAQIKYYFKMWLRV